jgi:dihydrofolate synthase/folylpolyglutamate synthase
MDGFRKLVACLRETTPFDELYLSFSKRSVEEVNQFIKILEHGKKVYKRGYLTSFEHERSMDVKNIRKRNLGYLENWKQHLEKSFRQKEKKYILVTGSYYFIGEVQKFLGSCSHSICPD